MLTGRNLFAALLAAVDAMLAEVGVADELDEEGFGPPCCTIAATVLLFPTSLLFVDIFFQLNEKFRRIDLEKFFAIA